MLSSQTDKKTDNGAANSSWNFWLPGSLKQRSGEEIEQEFGEIVELLHQVNLELQQTATTEDLFRRAVEMGHIVLGLDRVGIFTLDHSGFAVSRSYFDHLGTIDPRDAPLLPLTPGSRGGEAVAGKAPVIFENVSFTDLQDNPVGVGTNFILPLWDKEEIFGLLIVDIFSDMASISKALIDYLELYADMVSQLYSLRFMSEKLLEQQKFAELIEENIADVVWVRDRNFQFNYLSSSVEHVSGFTVEEAKKLTLPEIFTPASLESVKHFNENEVMPLMTSSQPIPHREWMAEREYYRKDGSTFWAEVHYSTLRDENGYPLGMLGVARDITERRNAQLKLLESEKKLHNIFMQSPIGIEIFDGEGRRIEYNPAVVEIFGDSDGNLQALNLFDIIPRETIFSIPRGETLRNELAMELSFPQRPFNAEVPRTVYTDSSLTPLWREGDNRPFGYMLEHLDITERKQVEKALRESEAKFQALAENIPAVSSLDYFDGKQYHRLYQSPQIESLLGYTSDEWYSTPGLWGKLLYPGEYERLEKEQQWYLDRNLPFAADYRIYDRNGRLLWVHDVGSRILDENGQELYRLNILMDITAQKAAEENEQLLQQFEESERIKTEFLSLTSQELRAPLAPLRESFKALLSREPGPLNDKQEIILEMADRQTGRLSRLVNDLLDIFRLESGGLPMQLIDVNMHKIIRESCMAYKERFAAKGLTLRWDCEGESSLITGDPMRLEQVLDNLLYNAIKYTEKGGVTVHLSNGEQALLLEVADSGIGIPPEQADKIFKRFYQVNGFSEGVGLGLAIVKHIIEAHRGAIWFESDANGGTTFFVSLPTSPPNPLS